MAVAVALPLAPALAPQAAAGVSAFVAGSAYLAQGAFQFRRGRPALPRLTGLEGEPTLAELIGDAVAGARLPVGTRGPQPPPPNFPQLVGALVGGAVVGLGEQLSQLWGLLNGRPAGSGGGLTEEDRTTPGGVLSFPSPRTVSVRLSMTASWNLRPCDGFVGVSSSGTSFSTPVAVSGVVRIELPGTTRQSFNGTCGGAATIPAVGGSAWAVREDGSRVSLGSIGLPAGEYPAGVEGFREVRIGWDSLIVGGAPVAFDGAPAPSGFVPPQVVPDRQPRRPLAPPQTAPSPGLVPQLPPDPGTGRPLTPAPQPPGTPAPAIVPTTPALPDRWRPGGPGAPAEPQPPGFPGPATVPQPARVPRPGEAPAPPVVVPTTPAGVPLPVPAPRPRPTPIGSEVVGNVPIPNRPPAPTLQGIAGEVGRIEQKLAVMLRQPEGEAPDLSELLDRLRELLGGDAATVPGGVYSVRPPCGRGPDGGPLPPVEVPVPDAPDVFGAILARLDALAALVDEQKQLRGPVCKGKPTGEPVTVTFLEVG